MPLILESCWAVQRWASVLVWAECYLKGVSLFNLAVCSHKIWTCTKGGWSQWSLTEGGLRHDTSTQYAPLSPASLGDWAINTTQSFQNYFSVAVSSLSHGRGQRPSTWSRGGLLCQPQWQKFSESAGGLSLGLKHVNDHLWWQLCLADWHTVFARKETERIFLKTAL